MTTTSPPADYAVATWKLGKRFGSFWALRDCSVTVPAGRISALIGPNGAGKTTLLQLLAGLSAATCGRARVFGRAPGQDGRFLSDIGFLAQEIPLYRRFTSADHLAMGSRLNPRWDGDWAQARLESLGIPLDKQAGRLSGGQRAQLALALALAKRPRLLLLDEPVAALDPLARRDFFVVLSEAAAGGDLTVLLSSHLVSDLDRVCDHLILLAAAEVQLCGDMAEILGRHKVLTGSVEDAPAISRRHEVLNAPGGTRSASLLIRASGPVHDPAWQVRDPNLEEVVLAYMGRARARLGAAGVSR
jgi:ABC-2 type transport system ATP-binding protein